MSFLVSRARFPKTNAANADLTTLLYNPHNSNINREDILFQTSNLHLHVTA